MKITSGTVSNIVWHFTGGPKWNSELNTQSSDLKPIEEACAILKKIIDSKYLRVGSYKEVFKKRMPYLFNFIPDNPDSKQGKLQVRTGVIADFPMESVCCLAEIPIQHLQYHSIRYGKCAIGFYRESAIDSKFIPVNYTLLDSFNNENMYELLVTAEDYKLLSNGIKEQIEKINAKKSILGIDDLLENINELIKENSKFELQLKNILSYVKVFSKNELESVYCEREWRSTNDYHFSFDDIALITLPKEKGLFNQFITEVDIPRRIPIIPWEDLIEN